MAVLIIILLLSRLPSLTLQQQESQQQLPPPFRRCYGAEQAGNYTSNSQFSANLRSTLLPTLTSDAPAFNLSTYSYSSAGQDPDRVFGFAQCLSAASAQVCGSCLNQSMIGITRLCPNNKRAAVRYDNCVLRYSDQAFLSDPDPGWWSYDRNGANATSPATFSDQISRLMGNLTMLAALSPTRLAVGETSYMDSSLYGMAQCNQDLNTVDCQSCLQQAMGLINNQVGAKIYLESCDIRYDIFPFYPAVGLSPPPAPSPPPPPSPPKASSPSNPAENNGSKQRRNIIIGVAVSVASAFAIAFAVCIRLATKNKRRRGVESKKKSLEDATPLLFDVDGIRTATDNFAEANKLGQGGFGPVYKGKLSDGQEIAVKRLLTGSSNQGITELRNEVALLAKLPHRNLVKLLGWCLEEHEKFLVYEFVPNSSLEKFLFEPSKSGHLTWEIRYKIIGGIARGLLYLHQDSPLRIIHRDLKASNILLDAEMNAKISDFGLAKICGADQTQDKTTHVAGTRGYMAPEYVLHGRISTKSDVYSFGILVLEIITGCRNSSFHESEESISLPNHVWKHWKNGKVSDLIDGSLGEDSRKEIARCVNIGLLCVQKDAGDRPSMPSIVLMLSGPSVTLPSPSPPAFHVFTENSYPVTDGRSLLGSENGASISDMVPR